MWIFERSSWSDRLLSLLRIVAGIIFLSAGTMKLFGYPPAPQPLPVFAPWSQFWLAGIFDTFGGMLIALGLFTRPVAFILSGEMAVAYFQVHFPVSIYPTANNGMAALLFCFLYLYFSAAGAGPWSLDALIAKRLGDGAGKTSQRSESRAA